jgi:hypothetical protein
MRLALVFHLASSKYAFETYSRTFDHNASGATAGSHNIGYEYGHEPDS